MGFADEVYNVLRKVPPGRVTTYKELAHSLNTNAYRAVGQALRRNPYAPEVPCHRVVSSDGRIGGFGGCREGTKIEEKARLLRIEGIIVENNKIKDFKEILFRLP
jgi:methylated-DNA-[protein]-cysteine S-methyltransferase